MQRFLQVQDDIQIKFSKNSVIRKKAISINSKDESEIYAEYIKRYMGKALKDSA
jgi:hypothetical protein